MIDDDFLGNRVREAIRAGDLPDRLPDKLLGGTATGGLCAVCGESTHGGVEMELVFTYEGERSYFTHPRCLSIFEREIQALSRRKVAPTDHAAKAC